MMATMSKWQTLLVKNSIKTPVELKQVFVSADQQKFNFIGEIFQDLKYKFHLLTMIKAPFSFHLLSMALICAQILRRKCDILCSKST